MKRGDATLKINKIINISIVILCLCLVASISVFIYGGNNSYKISNHFRSLPLPFNPDDSYSTYQIQNTEITGYGGFIKAIQSDNSGRKTVVIRALSLLPTVTVKGEDSGSVSLLIENINPDLYPKSISDNTLSKTKVAVNALKITIALDTSEMKKMEPLKPMDTKQRGYIQIHYPQ
ncbi:hypothetical protein [Carnobacterium funditum]|uniref:hypothetical protein n=1 Tax=Carnobacterium funditum TaxID=2752 RepID=UPI0012EC702B|nr:hypothetical protein [Carnobacterium funditum]